MLLTGALDIDKVDVVSSRVHSSPERHGVRNLAMEPDIFVGWKQCSDSWTDDADDVTKLETPVSMVVSFTDRATYHRQQNETAIVGKTETGTTGGPNGIREPIQRNKVRVSFLRETC
jgi:hypothetical protein